jgi:hypothetical protein
MNKKNNIEELFKDSMDDFRVDPPEETSKKILLGLFWSNVIYKYKGAMFAALAAAMAGVGAYFYMNVKKDDRKVANSAVEVSTPKQNQQQSNEGLDGNNFYSKPNTNNQERKENELQTLNHEESVNAIPTENLLVNKTNTSKKKNSTSTTIESSESTSRKQDDALIGPYGYMGKEGSVERREYDKKINEGGFPNLAAPSEEPNNTVAANIVINNSAEEKSTQEVISLDTKVDSTSKSELTAALIADTLQKLDSVAEKKNKKLSYFAGVNVSQSSWNQTYNNNEISPANQFSLLGGFIYKNYRLSSGLGYETQSIRGASDSWTVLDSTSNLKTTIVYDTITKDFDTTVVEEFNPYEVMYTREGSIYQMSYINLPIQLGYAYRFKKSDISIKLSTTLHFLVYKSITEPFQEGYGNVDLTSAPPKKVIEPASFLMDYSIHLNYGYHFTDKWMLSLGLFTRQNLMNPLVDSSIEKNVQAQPRGYGAELQLFYKF